MKLFDRLSIKNKLMAIILTVTTTAILGGATLAMIHDVASFKAEMVENIVRGVKTTNAFLATDLALGDTVEAARTLSRLDILSDINYACVYDSDGVRFAEMGTGNQGFEISMRKASGHQFDGKLLHLFHPVDFQGKELGTIYIKASTDRLYTIIVKHMTTMVLIMFGVVGVAVFVAFKLQGLITRPILDLAATASAISKEADYSIRVTRKTNDEIGVLFDGFNSMLEKIERRDQTLRQSEAQYRTLFEQATDAIFIIDSDGNFIDASPSTCKIVGYSREELLKLSIGDLIPDEDLQSEPLQLDALKAGKLVVRERRFRHKDTSLRTVDVSAKMVADGRIQVFARDITVRKQAEEKNIAALAEKEVMLKEIHHRVKNNLQVISSLLNLQSRYIKDDATLALFMESSSRVRSMALIHEKLYQTKDFSQVDFSDYTRDLSAQLFRAYNVNPEKVQLKIELKDVHLGIDVAVPCGLIINELLTNALKYAFPGDRKGSVKLNLHTKRPLKRKPEHGSQVVLTVSDDGIGLPAGFDIGKSTSLGMQLVKTLSEQIDGVLQIRSGKGTHFEITFEAETGEKSEGARIADQTQSKVKFER